ncbi:ankyrin repeat domain-containing protein [Leucothrix pacifica]|uniref:Uncharacterized protein n=1 Tax=Leucothrix pacifica TaxID=1247513 RepID=A0A317CGL7_9GAMM|nr:ankyrin repeat domain-containing protein [Leucothrix pacifica]PWQ97668.1 hypothetical protein DKW60_09825 [Leucothrix pacifica]
MKQRKLLILSTMLGGVLLPLSGLTHHYTVTPGYFGTVNWANSLNGVSFNDPRFNPYCSNYAQTAVKQAQRRISQQCTSKIPTHTQPLKDRWNTNQWGHKGWCMSVSSHASRNELMQRENGLKHCMTNHAPSNAQIRQACLANDNMHKKAAAGDYNYVKKCLDAGVHANIREGNNWTPLHSAARNGRLNVVQLLMQRGAQVNARDVTNRTPLDQAIAGSHWAVQNYLTSMGGVTR